MTRSGYRTLSFIGILAGLFVILNATSQGQLLNNKTLEQQALKSFKTKFGDRITIGTSPSTSKVSFLRLSPDSSDGLVSQRSGRSATERAEAFLRTSGRIFGLRDPDAELGRASLSRDTLDGLHFTYSQNYRGVPVFGGVIKLHFDSRGDLRSANGNIVPDIDLDPSPTLSRETAQATALNAVSLDDPKKSALSVSSTDLVVYRTGLAQGISGENHLAWQVVVGNGGDLRKSVFVDAHDGTVVDQIASTFQDLDRRVYSGQGVPVFPPTSYPLDPFWREGFLFPTGNVLADELIAAEGDTYSLYRNAFGRDSYDDGGGAMTSFFDFGFSGNAWASPGADPPFTAFGDDLIADDVVAHEWTHVYTYFTDGLIYVWQPGALNESYSDIFGEVVDQLNGRGSDAPAGPRDSNMYACPIFSTPLPVVRINPPSQIAGDYEAAYNVFGIGSPGVPGTGFTGDLVAVDDGVDSPTDGCSTPFVNADEVAGKIAFIEATFTCTADVKVKNAQLNGAVAVILANDQNIGESEVPFGGPIVTSIPSVNVAQSTGNLIRTQLANGVNATVFNDVTRNTDTSYRWRLGEDITPYGWLHLGRDMWNPACYFHPGRTRENQYGCFTDDNGGVHHNSGIPNHTFALVVDGGSYNGQTIRGIGLTKAAHIYFRAMTVYQVPFTDFADHAEALEAAAADLLGRDLPDLRTGLPSGQRISPSDLSQVHRATLATELRDAPQCNFRRVLGNNPPADSCSLPATRQTTLFSDTFEGNPFIRWSVTREVADDSIFRGGNWSWVRHLPDGRPGSGFFAYDYEGGCDLPYPSQLGILELASPPITIPNGLASGPHMSFDHWVATEGGYDGGQLMISVNDGPFQLVPRSAFVYSAYNRFLLPFPYSDNVRGGQRAFTGTDGGSLTGSWGTSIVDLTNYAHSGDTVRLRFDMSTDSCSGTGLGWYLDNVRVYACDMRGQP